MDSSFISIKSGTKINTIKIFEIKDIHNQKFYKCNIKNIRFQEYYKDLIVLETYLIEGIEKHNLLQEKYIIPKWCKSNPFLISIEMPIKLLKQI